MDILAYAFEKDNIYYTITSSANKEVEVTFKTSDVTTDTYVGVVTIPESVTYDNATYKVTGIGRKAFYQEDKLEKVSLPSTIKTIGAGAFSGCDNLMEVSSRGSSGIETLQSSAFFGCPSLQSVPDFSNISNLPNDVFYQCGKLEKVIFSSKLTAVDKYSFNECYSLKSAGDLSNIKSVGDYSFSGCKILEFNPTDFSQITSVGYGCFAGCTKLESIDLSNATIKLRNNESEAFSGCTSLKTVTFPKTATEIPASIFGVCDGLTAVHISNLESWCNIVFANGSGNPLDYAKHLYLNGEEITELTIPGNIKSIGDYQFYNCVGMTSIIMHDSIKTIGEGAFSDCDGLTEINLPDSLTIIGEDAFSSCNNLRTISLPKNITSIGKGAFAWNYDIESVYSFAETPVACEENIFTSSTYNDATLYIPHGTEVAYSQTSPWNKFKIKSISTSVENVVPDNQTSDKVCIYTIDGKLFKKGFDFIKEAKGLPSNVYIINGKKVYVK